MAGVTRTDNFIEFATDKRGYFTFTAAGSAQTVNFYDMKKDPHRTLGNVEINTALLTEGAAGAPKVIFCRA